MNWRECQNGTVLPACVEKIDKQWTFIHSFIYLIFIYLFIFTTTSYSEWWGDLRKPKALYKEVFSHDLVIFWNNLGLGGRRIRVLPHICTAPVPQEHCEVGSLFQTNVKARGGCLRHHLYLVRHFYHMTRNFFKKVTHIFKLNPACNFREGCRKSWKRVVLHIFC